MNKSKMSYRNRLVLFPMIVITGYLFLLTFSIPVSAQSHDTAWWKSAGGKKILSGTYELTESWTSNSGIDPNLYWKGGFYLPADERNYVPYDNAVKNDVAPEKGQITVKGPGIVVLFTKQKWARVVMRYADSKGGFIPTTYAIVWDAKDKKWKGGTEPLAAARLGRGEIKAGDVVTLDVSVVASSYNNRINTGELTFFAPQSVEFEIWFLAREGGEVIKPGPGGDKPKLLHGAAGWVVKGTIFDETANKTLKPGDSVLFGHTFSTDKKQIAQIIFGNDSKTEILVRKNSKIKVKRVTVTKEKPTGINRIFVILGRVWSLFRGKRGPGGYAVETYNSVTSFEGTSYETAYDPDSGITTVSVFEGVVRLTCKFGEANPVIVNAGMQATMDNNCNHTLSILSPDANTPAKAGWPDTLDDPGKIDDKPDKDIVRLEPVADSHVYAYSYRNWDKSNRGAYNILVAGWHPTGGESRAYLKFNLAGVDPNSVEKAILRVFHYHTGGRNSLSVGIHAVTGAWQEGGDTYHSGQIEKPAAPGEISWVNQPTFDPSPMASFNPGSGRNKHIEVDITPLVKAWLSGKPNYGLVITPIGILSSSTPESAYRFYSREHEDKTKRPLLIFQFSGGIDTPDEDSVSPELDADAKEAYQQYISAYNKLTKLMAQGKGDTPEARLAYQQYKKAKDEYEAGLQSPPKKKVTPVPTTTDNKTSPLFLTASELPPGMKVNPTANRVDEFDTVKQKLILSGSPGHAIEVTISTWGPATDRYFNWKHGMVWTGEFTQVPVKIGEMQLYTEEKAGCAKQLIMKSGGKLVEMHRLPVDGFTQANDPISRDEFLAIARQYEAKTGGGGAGKTADNPDQFIYHSWVWPVKLENGNLMVRGPGHSKWGTHWVTVATGVQSYTGVGTSQGPVVLWTRDGNHWNIIMLQYATGAMQNPRNFTTPTFIERRGKYGVILRVANKYYDYSWGHLQELYVTGGTIGPGPSAKKKHKSYDEAPDDIGGVPDEPTPGTGDDPGTDWSDDEFWLEDDDDPMPTVQSFSIPPTSPDIPPDWMTDPSEYGVLIENHDPSEMAPGRKDTVVLNHGERVTVTMIREKTGQKFQAVFVTDGGCRMIGANTLVAHRSGDAILGVTEFTLTWTDADGTKQQLTITEDVWGGGMYGLQEIWVNPSTQPASGWPVMGDDQSTVVICPYYGDKKNRVKGAVVEIRSGTGQAHLMVDTSDSAELSKVFPDEWLRTAATKYGVYIFSRRQFNAFPPGRYRIYVYKRTDNVRTDLHIDEKTYIAIPPEQDTWWLNIPMEKTSIKFPKIIK